MISVRSAETINNNEIILDGGEVSERLLSTEGILIAAMKYDCYTVLQRSCV
jgi:hypothetical protein